jgi:4-hydroxy-4-methyl-2-oxoglutarate aldolase
VRHKDTQEYFDELERRLYAAVISDVLDALGYRSQTMRPDIRPISPEMVVVGRAKTVQAADVNRMPQRPYAKQIEVLDSIRPGEVFVADTGRSKRSAFFGELMSTATQAAGGRGAVIDGLARDARQIMELGFPTFVRGFRPTDSLGRNEVIEYEVPIECGGVPVNPGDLIFGDFDGVVVVPAAIEDETVHRALEKVKGENLVRDALLRGMKTSEAFERYGVL